MMAANGGPREFDARDHVSLHEALIFLLQAADEDDVTDVTITPDPEVGRRVSGVTRALWSLVSAGQICVAGSPTRPTFVPSVESNMELWLRLRPKTQKAIYFAAQRWATSETFLKNCRHAATSANDALVAIEGIPRQGSDSEFRHWAVKSN